MDKAPPQERNSSPPDLPCTTSYNNHNNQRNHSFSNTHSPMVTSPIQLNSQYFYDNRYIRQRGSFDFGTRPRPIDPPINLYIPGNSNTINNYVRTRAQVDQSAINSLTSPTNEKNPLNFYQPTLPPLQYLGNPPNMPPNFEQEPMYYNTHNNQFTALPPFRQIDSLSDQVKNELYISKEQNKKVVFVNNNLPIHPSDQREVRPRPPVIHRCEKCTQVFGRKNSLTRHQKLHTGLKNFHCQHCKKSFSRRDILLRHHSSQKCIKKTKAFIEEEERKVKELFASNDQQDLDAVEEKNEEENRAMLEDLGKNVENKKIKKVANRKPRKKPGKE